MHTLEVIGQWHWCSFLLTGSFCLESGSGRDATAKASVKLLKCPAIADLPPWEQLGFVVASCYVRDVRPLFFVNWSLSFFSPAKEILIAYCVQAGPLLRSLLPMERSASLRR